MNSQPEQSDQAPFPKNGDQLKNHFHRQSVFDLKSRILIEA